MSTPTTSTLDINMYRHKGAKNAIHDQNSPPSLCVFQQNRQWFTESVGILYGYIGPVVMGE